VTYTAGCRLTVFGDDFSPCPPIVDHGAGHGIDRDKGLALESAIKEACTDALKRCAKSYGNVLGLALYDREQRNVSDGAPAIRESVARLIEGLRIGQPEAQKAIKDGWSALSDAEKDAATEANAAFKVSKQKVSK